MKKVILILMILVMFTSCALLDPNGLSYNPETAPSCFEDYDCSYIPDSMIRTYSVAGEHHIVFR